MPLSTILALLHVLAVKNSSGFDDFLSQISGLLIVTCVAGLIWVALMALVMQRASERRRRSQQGLDPLPGIHVTAYKWVKKMLASGQPSPAAQKPPERKKAPAPEPVLAPDLGMLVGNLDQPNVDALSGESDTGEELSGETPIVEMPAVYVPTPEPEPAYNPVRIDLPEEIVPMPESSRSSVNVAPPPDAVEVLRVWRDLADGGLIVEIGGRQFRSLNELRSAELERRFLNVVRDLNTLSSTPGRRTESPPVSSAAPLDVPSTALPAEPQAPVKPAQKDAGIDLPQQSLSPGSMLRQMRRVAMGQTPEPIEARPVLSIAEQIEALLQERLADHPDFSQRSIHVSPSLHGGVKIEVDGKSYEGVGDVEDEAVRNFLIDIVREWEQGQ